MSIVSKSMLTIVLTTAAVAALGYFFGFAMLFAHTTAEIFWYALLFGGSNILALSALWFANKDEIELSESKRIAANTATKAATAAGKAAAKEALA